MTLPRTSDCTLHLSFDNSLKSAHEIGGGVPPTPRCCSCNRQAATARSATSGGGRRRKSGARPSRSMSVPAGVRYLPEQGGRRQTSTLNCRALRSVMAGATPAAEVFLKNRAGGGGGQQGRRPLAHCQCQAAAIVQLVDRLHGGHGRAARRLSRAAFRRAATASKQALARAVLL